MQRELNTIEIKNAVRELFLKACCDLPEEMEALLTAAFNKERDAFAKSVIGEIRENTALARQLNHPMCQDTGMAVIFLTLGQEVRLTGEPVEDMINAGVREAYEAGYFRKSVLSPIGRVNTGDNTPAIVHYTIVPGDKVRLQVAPKGFGSENMSRLFMLTPSKGREGVVESVVEAVRSAGANPCPPVLVGVGIGGTMEKAALMAKHALLRPAGQPSTDAELAVLEAELLEKINALGIGPMGLGGDTTALAVHCESFPTHLAGLPVAVNMQCHAARHGEAAL